MNIKRGLFRWWIIVSVVWTIFWIWMWWKVLLVPGTKLCTAADIAGAERCHPVTTSDRFDIILETIIMPPVALIGLGLVGFWLVRWVGRGFRSS